MRRRCEQLVFVESYLEEVGTLLSVTWVKVSNSSGGMSFGGLEELGVRQVRQAQVTLR
jgi:hypothetical protein